MWELRHNLGAYDAAYIALAEALGCELLTGDVKLKTAAGHHAAVRVADPALIAPEPGTIRCANLVGSLLTTRRLTR